MIQFIFSSPDIIDSLMVCGVFGFFLNKINFFFQKWSNLQERSGIGWIQRKNKFQIFPIFIFRVMEKKLCGRQFWNAVERKPIETRVLNPTASEASYKPKQRRYRKTKQHFFFLEHLSKFYKNIFFYFWNVHGRSEISWKERKTNF